MKKLSSFDDCKPLAKKLGTTPEKVANAFGIKFELNSLNKLLNFANRTEDIHLLKEIISNAPLDSEIAVKAFSKIETLMEKKLKRAIEFKHLSVMWEVAEQSLPESKIESSALNAIIDFAEESNNFELMWHVYRCDYAPDEIKSKTLSIIKSSWLK